MGSEMESSQNIPSFLNSEAFISARFKEISALKNLINENNRVTSIFQRLPKHMRRRAMSHTVKRLPRTLRESHKRQLEKNKALKTQRRPRKYFRKRPQNLLLEYNRRQRNTLWLETHIWHAKRFRMISKWGYRLADRSCDKTFRASYRATSTHCLLQDLSYFSCIEITGNQHTILDGFKHVTNSNCGLTIGAKCWLSGNREGKVTIFHKDCYPQGVIGDVTFIWKPEKDSTELRTVWIWCHPSYYTEFYLELVNLFELEQNTSENMEIKNTEDKICKKKKTKKSKENIERTKIDLKNIPHTRIPEYYNKQSKIRLLLLKDTLNRFRLTGPLSNTVLTSALHPAELFDKFLSKSESSKWWEQYRNKSVDTIALKLLEKYNSPTYFSPHSIIGGHVIDPRLFLKRIRSKAIGKYQEIESYAVLPPQASKSAIWDPIIRDDSSLNKFTSARINQLRSDLLVPGHDQHLLSTVNTIIPLLFVQRPGSSDSNVKSGYGSGWDIIIPANWAMPVWLSLILCGAKSAGLRESKTLNFESKKMPELPPDSQAGRNYYEEIEKSDREFYFRKPPNKRTNYIKNGFSTPFHYPWNALVDEWTSTGTSFYVLRDRQILIKLKTHLDNVKNTLKLDLRIHLESIYGDRCLIPVTVHMIKGQLKPFSHICSPTRYDLQYHSEPVEKRHIDNNEIKRKQLKKQHSKLLKRLRRQRIKLNKTSEKKLPLKITKRKHSPTEEIVQKYLSEMRDLWVPPTISKIRNHCSREICGFVVNSGFSFMESRIVGQGYITLQSLCAMNDMWQNYKCDTLVLTRSPDCLNYRYGLLKVCIS